ncbi:MAG: YihY/virulence factor BrkB family protein [Acidimicrobiales bacterium]|nr:YihY/virulence factor BrkB family protein [Acidimicrobiales bacterium]
MQPGEPTDSDRSTDSTGAKRPGFVDRYRPRVEAARDKGLVELEERRRKLVPVDLAMSFYERDRDAFASVLGSAIALRLFLFAVPATLVIYGIIIAVFGADGIRGLLSQSNIGGSVAEELETATSNDQTTGFGIITSGLFLLALAGRTLTKVLAACAAGAWGYRGRESKATFRMAVAVTSLVMLLLFAIMALNRIRARFGLAVETGSWLVTVLIFAGAWFAVTLTLPRRTRDPSALLPGAALVGLAMTGIQAFMQLYLPGQIDRNSDLLGPMAVSLAALTYFFLVGRMMAAGLILNAVVFERLGSIGELVFRLPLVRALPRRFPAVGRFFDLDRSAYDAAADDEDDDDDEMTDDHDAAGPPAAPRPTP